MYLKPAVVAVGPQQWRVVDVRMSLHDRFRPLLAHRQTEVEAGGIGVGREIVVAHNAGNNALRVAVRARDSFVLFFLKQQLKWIAVDYVLGYTTAPCFILRVLCIDNIHEKIS